MQAKEWSAPKMCLQWWRYSILYNFSGFYLIEWNCMNLSWYNFSSNWHWFDYLDIEYGPDIKIPSSYGAYYEVYINEKSTWDVARNKCKNRGGLLATIDTSDEKKSIVQPIYNYLSTSHGTNWRNKWRNLWIGLKKGIIFVMHLQKLSISFVLLNNHLRKFNNIRL